ncbi:FYN-binding protein 1 isoform X3 [Hyperolius riggenbachi]
MEETANSPGPPALKTSFQQRLAGFQPQNSTPPTGITPKKPTVPKPAPGPKFPPAEVKPAFPKPSGVTNRNVGSFHKNSQEKEETSSFPKPPVFKSPSQHKEEPKPQFPKPIPGKTLNNASHSPQEPKFGGVKSTFSPEPKVAEEKPAFPKPSQLKSLNSASENETKPLFQKKPPFAAKSPANMGGSTGENNLNKHHGPLAKTFSTPQDTKPVKHTQESSEENMSSSPSQPLHGVQLRPTGIKQLQSPFLNKSTDESNDRTKPNFIPKDFQGKASQQSNSSSPFAPKYPGTPSSGLFSTAHGNLREQKDSSAPKRKLLPSLSELGPAPHKPTRPPKVNLDRFKTGKINGGKVPVSEQKSSALSSALPPLPPAGKSTPPAPSLPSLPSLPPRNVRQTLKTPSESGGLSEDENYDDVVIPDGITDDSIEEEEFYDDISDTYKKELEEKNDKKKKKEQEKAEKEQKEREKKEQKEREKREQEIRKRFKLSDKVDVLHQAKACVDHKGGKNELSFKKGDDIEIIRVTDNPEEKWLGRMNGNYGYIKTTMVSVDYDSLKRKKIMQFPVKPLPDQEIYDDVGEQDSLSNSGGSAFFPPPPSNDDDIYDVTDDDPVNSSVPQEEEKGAWSWLKKRVSTQVKKKDAQDKTDAGEESEFSLSHSSIPEGEGDVYDDVETADFPPPPLELTVNTKTNTLGKSPDYKTLKKMEKEEKEFRKKFKFTGDIKVLSSVHVTPNLTTKKFGSKDLTLKPGETLEVIQHTNDSTLLCRNSDGKYGYVSRSNVFDYDGEIYDDIGEDCIYDND